MKTMLIALLLAAPLVAQAEFWTGTQLLNRLDANDRIDRGIPRNGDFVDSGVADGFVTGVFDVQVHVTFCAQGGVTVGQVRRIVHAYIRAVPHRHHEPAYRLVHEALMGAFPCAERRQQQGNL
jgi:hypothetical protein